MSTHSVLRYEAALKVTGSAIYEAEVPAAGLLHAAFVQSPISCGDVSSVDATRAVDLPGFAAMVSYADTEVLQASPATALIRERTVHFAGQPVALVAARTSHRRPSLTRYSAPWLRVIRLRISEGAFHQVCRDTVQPRGGHDRTDAQAALHPRPL